MASAADATASLPDDQKAAIEAVVRDLLTKKEPELVLKAAQAAQEKMEAESTSKAKQAILANKERLYNDPSAPVAGNPKGDAAVVAFLDYQCGYCKAVIPTLKKLVEQDKDLRIIYKEYPILGEGSTIAAKAALASVKQGKYFKLHEALFTAKDHFANEDQILKLAKEVGIDVDRLKKDMADDSIDKIIAANRALGQLVGAHGTPTFIIGNDLVPGVLPLEQMKDKIAQARKESKK
jgi:protein-disulfide isomerase